MPKYSYKNFEPDEYDKYYFARRDSKSITLSFFTNAVAFDAEHKTLKVQVDSSKEYEDDERDKDGNVIDLNPVMPPKIDIFEAKKIETDHSRLNKYSGYEIDIPLGEGVLDFCTADFESEIDGFYNMYAILNPDNPHLVKVFTESNGKKIPANLIKEIKNTDEEFEERVRLYARLMDFGNDYMYKSLYSAIFPPLIFEQSDHAIKHYFNYISVLQKEFNEILEFCFDVDFYPKEMKRFTSLDRYHLYCLETERPLRHRFDQEYGLTPAAGAREERFPYGYPQEELMKRFKSLSGLISDKTVVIEKYNIKQITLDIMYTRPSVLSIHYSCSNVWDMLSFEVMKMLEQGVQIKRCKLCGKYFVLKGNYATEYCNRIVDGETQTCQTIASLKNYKEKIGSNDAWKLYNKYYKRYFARAKVGTIKAPAFKQWQYNATAMRDDCTAGNLSVKDYEVWLDDSFPNRKKK